MNGASTEPCANTSSAPTASITRAIGNNHHFLRTRISAQSSRARLPSLISHPPDRCSRYTRWCPGAIPCDARPGLRVLLTRCRSHRGASRLGAEGALRCRCERATRLFPELADRRGRHRNCPGSGGRRSRDGGDLSFSPGGGGGGGGAVVSGPCRPFL